MNVLALSLILCFIFVGHARHKSTGLQRNFAFLLTTYHKGHNKVDWLRTFNYVFKTHVVIDRCLSVHEIMKIKNFEIVLIM